MAAARGAVFVSIHSATSRTALMANAHGTNLAGDRRETPLAFTATSVMEKMEVAMTIAGSEVTSSSARNSASRAALPATNCAVTRPAQMMAVSTAGEISDFDDAVTMVLCPGGRSTAVRSYH